VISDQLISQWVIGNRRAAWLIVIAAMLGIAVFLGQSAASGVWGFALDDAWIHQTYARNLVATGQFAFVPGQPSAGSTSPLWTCLIALGYLVRMDYKWWTCALGTLCLAATALGVWQLSLRMSPDRPRIAFAAGILSALEWHLIWAAVSGMETVLFTALSVWLIMVQYRASSVGYSVLFGVLGALLILTRPEGLVLIGLVLFVQIISSGWKGRTTWGYVALAVIVMIVSLIPWLVFNWRTSGTPFPNTFYAKQQEYAIYLSARPLARRFLEVFVQPFIGAQVLLIPGLIVAVWQLTRRLAERATWLQLAPLAWVLAHLGLYAVRLPVTYQHGRYEMPVIPIVILFGVVGTARLLRWNHPNLWPRVLSRVATLAMVFVLLEFVAAGARAYAADVSIIEGEMVRVARWLADNTAPHDLIAAHDIGAMGYFAQRPLLDLAGLISPEVIPFIRDEARLEALIRQRGAAYLVTFPSWYPHLVASSDLKAVFAGSARNSPDHIVVYRLPQR
jgi:hypothetical protein